jgi:NADH-quinone oxidoreductase subunit E
MNSDDIDILIEKHGHDESALIGIMQDVQKELNYLPQGILLKIAHRLDIPLSRIYSIATFYKAFSLVPRGRHKIGVCIGTACHVRGGQNIVEKLERELGIRSGQTMNDLKFTLETVRCLGCCSLAPVMRIDKDTYGRLNQSAIPKILKRYE